jgi:hypothetical protein
MKLDLRAASTATKQTPRASVAGVQNGRVGYVLLFLCARTYTTDWHVGSIILYYHGGLLSRPYCHGRLLIDKRGWGAEIGLFR